MDSPPKPKKARWPYAFAGLVCLIAILCFLAPGESSEEPRDEVSIPKAVSVERHRAVTASVPDTTLPRPTPTGPNATREPSRVLSGQPTSNQAPRLTPEPSKPEPQTAALRSQAEVDTAASRSAEVWSYPPLIQTNRIKQYTTALERLGSAKSDVDRYHVLSDVAKLAFVFGQTEEARNYATECLTLDQRFEKEIWRSGGGQAIHDSNMVLGRIALLDGHVQEATQYLVAAGQSTGSPSLGSFGPNMGLAKDLLEAGERDAVLKYFEQCRKFWSMGTEKLDQWTQDVTAGRLPDFGANLLY